MIVFFVLPATFDGINVHAKNRARTNGTVRKYMPHFVHLYSGLFGRRDIAIMPTKGGRVANAITNIRLFLTRRV